MAVSTLAAVALVRPLRSRVQFRVDRRFYRTRDNAFIRSMPDDVSRLARWIARYLRAWAGANIAGWWRSVTMASGN